MNEKPIMFNTEMVKAILDGRKVSTRRPLKTKEDMTNITGVVDYNGNFLAYIKQKYGQEFVLNPPYKVDEILYVQETFITDFAIGGQDEKGEPINVIYRADSEDKGTYPKWEPSTHMPKKYARIWLKVTNVRVERIQDITDQEAYSEGMQCSKGIPIIKFKNLWNSIYDNWDSDPWVWVIDFEVVKS